MKKIKLTTEYITLGQLLKKEGIIDNGGYAKYYLIDNDVYVNNEIEKRRGRKLYKGYIIKIDKKEFIIEE